MNVAEERNYGKREIILPPPISRKQGTIINCFFDPTVIELWVACGTKFGKSFGASVGYSGSMMLKQGALGRWIAPIYTQAKIGYKYCKKIVPPEPETDINKSEPSITFLGADTKMEFRSGKNPEDLEGEATACNVLDEAAKMKQQVYDSVKTTTTVTRGLIANFSTPRGKNWFYTKCMEARDHMEWSKRKGIKPTHIFLTAPSSENPLVTKAAIEEAQRTLPVRRFRQYFEAEFLDDGSVFLGFRDCVEPGKELLFDGRKQTWYHEDHATAPVVIGADWAKTHDRTVFWAIDLRTRRCVGFMRFYKTPYTEAIRRLQSFAKKFHDCIAVLHDKTGLGTVIDDYLAETSLPYEGVTFTNASKNDMATRLITGFEQQDLWLPNWQDAIDELDAYEVMTTLSGNLTYGAPPGKHDDIVCAIMLAYTGLMQYGDREYEVKFVEDSTKPKQKKPANVEEDQPEATSALEDYYKLLEEDAEDDD